MAGYLSARAILCALLLIAVSGCENATVQAPKRIPVPEAPACTNQNYSPEAIFSNSKDGVAVVDTDGGMGSAFVVRHQDNTTLLITNSHVVEGTDSVTVKWADDQQDNAAVVKDAGGESPQTDLALLEVSGIRGKALELKEPKPNIGSDVVAIGSPKGLEFSLTRGVVSSIREDGQLLQIDASINPGNSGGPVLDKTGCVVGVTTFKLTESEGLSFAVTSSTVSQFLKAPARPRREPEPNPLPEQSEPIDPEEESSTSSTCWFQMDSSSDRLQGFNCKISSRRNANGHLVFDVVEPGGLSRTIVLWEDKSAEVILKGSRYEGTWLEDKEGDIRVQLDGGEFAFSPK
jgi:S1-C subfamily serine protease